MNSYFSEVAFGSEADKMIEYRNFGKTRISKEKKYLNKSREKKMLDNLVFMTKSKKIRFCICYEVYFED